MEKTEAGIVTLSHCKMYLRADGILVVDPFDDVVFGKKEVAEIVDTIELLTGGKKVPVLSLFKPGNTADKEARDFTASYRGAQFTLADAMVVHNLPQKIIANFYIKFNRPSKPTRFFSCEQDAIEWLLTFL